MVDLDAGPLVQSSLTKPWDAVLEKLNILASKEMLETLTAVPPASTSIPRNEEPDPVSSSPQKNLPVVVSQPRAWLSASQSTMDIVVAESVRRKAEIEAVDETSKAPAMEAVLSNLTLLSTSRSPEMRRSSAVVRKDEVVVAVPKRE